MVLSSGLYLLGTAAIKFVNFLRGIEHYSKDVNDLLINYFSRHVPQYAEKKQS